jgi:hypothetical protein
MRVPSSENGEQRSALRSRFRSVDHGRNASRPQSSGFYQRHLRLARHILALLMWFMAGPVAVHSLKRSKIAAIRGAFAAA